MTTITQHRITLAAALVLPCIALLTVLPVPGISSTYAMFAALLIATAAIGFNTWKNGQATGSLGQLIYETETTPLTTAAVRVHESTSASRWAAWQNRGDALAQTGRVRALLALSLATTGVLLLYAWIA